jgi:hypothetical protein
MHPSANYFSQEKEMTMAHWFEDLTRTIADDKIGRRTAIRRVAGGVVGAALTSVAPGLALAKKSKDCPTGGGTCSNPNYPNCAGNSNLNCYCFTDITGNPLCACNMYCSGDWPCYRNSDCPRGSACIVSTGCNCSTSSGICIVRCKGKNKNCQLGSGHGTTAARVH